jgi:hypothetical protein
MIDYNISIEEEQEFLEDDFLSALEDSFNEENNEGIELSDEEIDEEISKRLNITEEHLENINIVEGIELPDTEINEEINEEINDKKNTNDSNFEKILRFSNTNLKNFILYESKIKVFNNKEKLNIIPLYLSNISINNNNFFKKVYYDSINIDNLKDINRLYALTSIIIGLINKKKEQNIQIINKTHKLNKIKYALSEIQFIFKRIKELKSEIKHIENKNIELKKISRNMI